ncbi:MAG: hypothetical protein AAF703_09335 [Cyanobacteria bacterium P01_D01_bin.105]
MRQPPRSQPPQSMALERRYPYRCKVMYFPQPADKADLQAPSEQMSWYLRSFILPRVGDVIPFGQSLFAVTTVIFEDCCSSDSAAKLDKLAGRLAARDDTPKWHAILWVAFWGVKSIGG